MMMYEVGNNTIAVSFADSHRIKTNDGILSLQEEKHENEQHLTSSISDDQGSMMKDTKEESVDSDSASTATTEYSSGSEVEQYLHEVAHSPRRFSLSDARIALSYVQGKIKQLEKTFDEDDSCKTCLPPHDNRRVLSALKHHECITNTYSSFHRPERNVIRHKMELLKKDRDSTFNIYTSDVHFVERPISISMIEDTSALEVGPVKDDKHCHALRLSKVMFPLLPPPKPPPLQLHTAVSRKHRRSKSLQYHHNDDDVSHVTYVETANMSSVVLDFENSDDCCSLLSHRP